MNTIETKINLILAMNGNKSKKIIKKKFTDYCKAFANLKDPDQKIIDEYKNTFLDYLRYMAKSGESQRDIQMHYKKGDENRDYFEHMDKEDIPKDVN